MATISGDDRAVAGEPIALQAAPRPGNRASDAIKIGYGDPVTRDQPAAWGTTPVVGVVRRIIDSTTAGHQWPRIFAAGIAERELQSAWFVGRERAEFALPPSRPGARPPVMSSTSCCWPADCACRDIARRRVRRPGSRPLRSTRRACAANCRAHPGAVSNPSPVSRCGRDSSWTGRCSGTATAIMPPIAAGLMLPFGYRNCCLPGVGCSLCI